MSYNRGGSSFPPRKRHRGDFYDGGDRYNNRPRQSLEESVLTRLRRDFIPLADPKPNSQSTAADDIDYVAKSIVSEYSKSDSIKASIHELLYNCVLELPPKIPYFASLFVVANARKQVVGKDILDFSVAKVKDLLEQGDLVKGKLMLRFLAGLTRIMEGEGIMAIIGEIVSKIEGQQANARTDNLAKLVLITLPYIAVSPKKPSEALDAIVNRLVSYMDSRDTNEIAFISPFQSPSTEPLGDYSSLHLLWLQTKALQEKEWDIPFLPRPWFAFRSELESNTKTHPTPIFSLNLDQHTIPPLEPEYYFSIFLNNEKQTVPQLSNIASSLLRDVVTDTVSQLVFNRKEGARFLIDLQQYFPTGLFHHSGLSIKDLPNPQPSRPKYKLEDVLVDAMFSQLLRLPAPKEREVYYAALLTEITKLAPQDVAPTLGRAIRWVYVHLDNLKGELNMRFSTWFAIHLSNFGFTYKWDEWISDLQLEEGMPKKVFLRETIDKEVRLSYLERIQRTLPEEYFAVFPEKAEVGEWTTISGKLGAGDDESEKLLEAIRARDESAITAYMEANPNSGELLVAGLLFVSHDTPYSHPIPPATVELLKKHTTPTSLIGTVMSFWKERPSTGTVLVMKYVDLGVITLKDVVAWLMEQDSWMRKSWGWELIQICTEKAEGRRQTLAQKNGNASENSNDKTTTDEENVMHVDSKNGDTNGISANERREMFEAIVASVGTCFERQGDQEQIWLKEWFAMVARKYSSDVDGLEGTGWVGEILNDAAEFRKRLL